MQLVVAVGQAVVAMLRKPLRRSERAPARTRQWPVASSISLDGWRETVCAALLTPTLLPPAGSHTSAGSRSAAIALFYADNKGSGASKEPVVSEAELARQKANLKAFERLAGVGASTAVSYLRQTDFEVSKGNL